MDTLGAWSWTFLVLYIGLMIHLGRRGQRQVASADDFAVARGAYGPLTLAVAYAATAATGATFLGLPGLAYQYGMGVLWVGLLYPVGIYVGVGSGGDDAGLHPPWAAAALGDHRAGVAGFEALADVAVAGGVR